MNIARPALNSACNEHIDKLHYRRLKRHVPEVMDVLAHFNAFLHIGEDGRVTCFAGKVELGQGPTTSLAQILALEFLCAAQGLDFLQPLRAGRGAQAACACTLRTSVRGTNPISALNRSPMSA